MRTCHTMFHSASVTPLSIEIERQPVEQLQRDPPPLGTGRADDDADEHGEDEDADADHQPRRTAPPRPPEGRWRAPG